jgi:alternate signal-mediated exported protein
MRMRGGGRATHRPPDRNAGSRRAVIALVATAAAGALLIGGIPAYAYFTASSTGSALSITSGSLAASATGPVTATTTTGATAPAGTVVRPGSAGIVPGLQAQTLTYTVGNTGTARARASLAFRVLTSSIADASAWAAIQPYLVVTAQIGSDPAVAVATTSAGIDQTVTSVASIAGGASTNVVLTFSIPATSGGVDLLRALQASRSTTTSIRSVLNLAPQITLTQVPLTSP